MGDSISANSLFNSYIKARKCSETEMVPSLDFGDHPPSLQGKGETTLERDKTVPRMKSGQMDGGPQGDPSRGKKEKNRLL